MDAVLREFEAGIREILGSRFVGMYLYGSLALGGFDPQGSDIDFLVATDGELPGELVAALGDLHTRFDRSGSRWAGKIEAAYIPVAILQGNVAGAGSYPQIESGGRLVLAPLEIGWPYQAHTLREYGVALVGPDPRQLFAPVDPRAMREAGAAIVADWVVLAGRDPEWLAWLQDRDGQSFVALTLCRILYTLHTGTVASKPEAARAAAQGLAQYWGPLIGRSLALQHRHEATPPGDVDATLALLRFTAAQLGL